MLPKAPEITGLSSTQVVTLLAENPKSNLPLRSNRTYWNIIQTNVFNIYNVILIASSLIVLLLKGSKDVLVALTLVGANIGIGVFQETKAKRTLDQLATLQTHLVHVRREGEVKELPLSQLVHGDVIEIFPGEPIVADGKILFSDSLELDESSLTGESETVPKKLNDAVTSGSYCLAGFGLMKAEKVGAKSSLYELTEKAKSFRQSQTTSEKWLKKLFQFLLYTILVLAPLTFISGINQGFSIPQTLSNVVNLVSSLIPQGMIVSMTILFAYGVVNISKYKTLVQRVNVVAIMGTITVLCADKTGTLTTNQLSLEKIIPLGDKSEEKIKMELNLYVHQVAWANKTIQALSSFLVPLKIETPAYAVKSAEIPFTSEHKWGGMSFPQVTLLLGAPDILTQDKKVLDQVNELAKKGFRVLALAESKEKLRDASSLPATRNVVALLTFQEHLRSDVKETVAALAKQKIALKIISGDSAETLRTIAAQLHIPIGNLYEQSELENIEAEVFSHRVKHGNFFARITPSMKENIIAELVAQGELVAMVGDGVNDVRALKKSHVAIAVNEATQVTKDVSDIILLDNSFASLPKAIEEGRDITQRVYAVAKIFFVKVIYLITLFLLAGFASFAFPISLRQTTWLGFIVVGIPTALITFKILKPSPTKNIQKGLIQYTLTAGIIGGLFMAAIMIITQLFLGNNIETSRTQVSLFASLFSTFILLQVHGINIYSLASMKRNFSSFVIIMVIGLIAILFPSELTPRTFQSAHLENLDWLILAFGIAGSIVLLRFILKRVSTFVEANQW